MASSSYAEKHLHQTVGSTGGVATAAADRSFNNDADHQHHHHHHPHTHSTPIAGSKATPHNTSTPPSSTKTSSLRGTKLARRARSFKDDLMERITQIRTPSGGGGSNHNSSTSSHNTSSGGGGGGGSHSTNSTLTRAQSPHTPRSRSHKNHHMAGSVAADMASSVASLLSSAASPAKHQQTARQPHQHDLGYHVHQVKFALKHFGDVVAKNKLEMLPGNGTVVLESVDTVLKMLNTMGLNERSSVLISARTQVHVALGRLIKLCDEVLLLGDVSGGGEMPAEPCAALSATNVAEVAAQIVEALEQLVRLAGEYVAEQKGAAVKGAATVTSGGGSANTLQRPSLENTAAGQRTSLPDIPLTPYERDSLEQTVGRAAAMRASHSTESVLRDSSPPPPAKPPLPNRESHPPPLPPKRRSATSGTTNTQRSAVRSASGRVDGGGGENDGGSTSNMLLSCGLDRMSMRSRSPDDNSSLLSASSLDSALNHSRDDDELGALVILDTAPAASLSTVHQVGGYLVEEPRDEFQLQPAVQQHIIGGAADGISSFHSQRNSNESGFVSMHSVRSSMLSTTTAHHQMRRASEHCTTTILQGVGGSGGHAHSGNADTTNTSVKSASCTFSDVSQQQQMQHQQSATSVAFVSQQQQQQQQQHHHQHQHHHQVLHNSSSNSSSTNNTAAAFLSASSSTATAFSSHHSSSTSVSMLATTASVSSSSTTNERTAVQHASFEQFRALSTDDTTCSAAIDGEQPPELPAKQRHTVAASCGSDPLASVQKWRSFNETRLHDLRQHSMCEQPPPLPAKKKHMFQSVAYSVMAYMEMLSNCSQTTDQQLLAGEFSRHSMHTYNMTQHHHHLQQQQHLQLEQQQQQHHHITHTRHISHSKTMSLSPFHHHNQTIIETPASHYENSRLIGAFPTVSPPDDDAVGGGGVSLVAENPPALPPKRSRGPSKSTSCSETPPASPKLPPASNGQQQQQQPSQSSASPTVTVNNALPIPGAAASSASAAAGGVIDNGGVRMRHPAVRKEDQNQQQQLKQKQRVAKSISQVEENCGADDGFGAGDDDDDDDDALTTGNGVNSCCEGGGHHGHDEDDDDEVVVLRHNQIHPAVADANAASRGQSLADSIASSASTAVPVNLIEELDISEYLVLKKPDEDGPDIKGGYLDALIVLASQSQHKHTETIFGEAFISTFRTFIKPSQLIAKLVQRYTLFCCQVHEQKTANESFSLLMRVVNDLTAPDLRSKDLSILIEFMHQLICSGQLVCAKLLRGQILKKIEMFKQQKWQAINPAMLPSRAVVTCPPTLLELKPEQLAQQMTLLDAELFQKIDIPEVLIWAQEQCEERSPNLTQFTEHFNKMSYWARSQILRQEDAKDRERYLTKFIKIMKQLRRFNNYNSYLALLSALDSAPIRRLDWPKAVAAELNEYCALIDSSSSFRTYRQALADTTPPCIPYIGLVLQDLTFVHIGNQDYLSDGVINFSKRWQQYNIVVNMTRFKTDSTKYEFKRNERIINFFDNFENCLDEDAMWQISEQIKPRVGRKQPPLQQQQPTVAASTTAATANGACS